MSMLDRLRGGSVATMTEAGGTVDEMAAALRAEQETNLLLTESIAELEMDNRGWLRLDQYAQALQFTRQGLVEIAASARLNWIANPLIRRAVNIRMFYTWGQGVEISCRDEDVNQLVQTFLDDPMNQQILFGHEAREEKDRALQLDGNLFFALFTSPRTGRVQVRSLPWTEITDIISDPEDRERRWLYKRAWTATTIDPATGVPSSELKHAFYPALGYRPQIRPNRFGQVDVMWDSPVVHVRTGGLEGQQFGMSDVYSVLGWARLYKGFLEDWASLAKALSKLAWKGTARSGKVGALRRAMEAPSVTGETHLPLHRPGAGQALVSDGSIDMTPINKSGATLDADSSRPLALMVAAGMDIPHTILMGDAKVGNRATARTLDRPTELAMQSRREMWSAVYRKLCDYAVDQAVKAPQGPLQGTVSRDEYGQETITLAGDVDRNLDIDWPSLLEHDILELVQSIVAADGTGRVPPEVICRLLLAALGVENLDEVMADLVDDEGNFLDPALAAEVTAGAQAVGAFRRGEDPAAAVR